MIKCVILDDEEMSRVFFRNMCKKVEDLEVVGEFEDPIEALKFLKKEPLDLLLLDIHMPELSGKDFLKLLDKHVQTILITSDPTFGVESYEWGVVDYLVKPVSFLRFLKAIEKLKKAQESEPKSDQEHLFISVERRLVNINLKDVLVIEARGDYVLVKTVEKNYTSHVTMKNMEKHLPSKNFVRVHRSFIVNLSKIVDIEDSSILVGKEIVPVSRIYRKNLMDNLRLLR